jgi:hypothetical protein
MVRWRFRGGEQVWWGAVLRCQNKVFVRWKGWFRRWRGEVAGVQSAKLTTGQSSSCQARVISHAVPRSTFSNLIWPFPAFLVPVHYARLLDVGRWAAVNSAFQRPVTTGRSRPTLIHSASLYSATIVLGHVSRIHYREHFRRRRSASPWRLWNQMYSLSDNATHRPLITYDRHCVLARLLETKDNRTKTCPPRDAVFTSYPMIFRPEVCGTTDVSVPLNTPH